MKTFRDWVHQEKGVDLDEVCSDTGSVAGYPRRLDGGQREMVKRIDQKPIVVGTDLKPKKGKGKNKKGKGKPKVKEMEKDFRDL